MQKFDYWRLCDDFSIVQAALLIAGEDLSQNSSVEHWDVNKGPLGYEAAKTAIVNALKRKSLEGNLVLEPEHDQNGNFVEYTDTVDLSSSIVSVGDLRRFLKKRGISDGFFFPDDFDDRNYLDPENSF